MPDSTMFKWLAVLIALTIGAMAFAISYIERQKEPSLIIDLPHSSLSDRNNSLSGELRKCQQLGEAAIRDQHCLTVWQKNRDRFLGKK